MPNIYYRFYLAGFNNSPSDLEASINELLQKLDKTNGFRFIRLATDFVDPQQGNFSVLCQTEDQTLSQSQIAEYLINNGILVDNDKNVMEVLEEEEEEVLCSHGCPPGKEHKEEHKQKHKNKQKHGHKHKHAHEQKHSHEHKHAKENKKAHEHKHPHEHKHANGHDHKQHWFSINNHWWQAGIGLIAGIALLALTLSGVAIPFAASCAIAAVSALVTLYLGRAVYQRAWNALREKKWDMTLLYSISTLTIVVVSIVSLFVPGLPLMLEAAPFVLGFWHLGEGIEHTLLDRLVEKLDVRHNLSPSVLLKGQADQKVSVKELIPNDILILKQGEVIPVDGVLLENTLLYTTSIDGSPNPKYLYAGDEVKAGMRLAENISSLELRASTTYQKSYLSLLAQHISKANKEKAPIELFANKVLKYFIPGLLAVAAISAVIIGPIFGPALAIQCLTSVLVSACPCALSLITPMAVKIGMNKAAVEGVKFKDGKALQAAANIDTVVFDLNGTLTSGNLQVKELFLPDDRYLGHVSLLESYAIHPAGKIIHDYLKDNKNDDLIITDPDNTHHSGIQAKINGERFMIGNQHMLLLNHIEIAPPFDNPRKGTTYIVRGNEVIGQIKLTDQLRPDAFATIKKLKELGIEVHLCTGADQATAEEFALALGIDKKNICADVVGVSSHGEQSKSDYIFKLKREGHKVAMVGDAANDAAAISDSDLGIAVKSKIGDKIVEECAGIILQEGNLLPIATAFDVSKKTKQNIFQNLSISLSFNSTVTLVAGGLFVGLGFALNPAIGVALMILESSIVLVNLFRLKFQTVFSAKNAPEAKIENKRSDSTANALHHLKFSPRPESKPTASHEAYHWGSLFNQEQSADNDDLSMDSVELSTFANL